MFRSTEYQRGYDAGYKQALLDAVGKMGQPERRTFEEQHRAFMRRAKKILGVNDDPRDYTIRLD